MLYIEPIIPWLKYGYITADYWCYNEIWRVEQGVVVHVHVAVRSQAWFDQEFLGAGIMQDKVISISWYWQACTGSHKWSDGMDRVEALSNATHDFLKKFIRLMRFNNLFKPCRSVENRRWSFASYASSGYSTTTQGSNVVSLVNTTLPIWCQLNDVETLGNPKISKCSIFQQWLWTMK